MKTDKIKFSLIMANYNNGKYIFEAINSVLRQTYQDWELVIIDDHSNDDSLMIIKPFLKDQRIKLLINKENFGYGAVCKMGVDNSSGQIIGFIDADDSLADNAIAAVLKEYETDDEIGVVYSTYYVCDNNLDIIKIESWVGPINTGDVNLRKSRCSHFRTFKREWYNYTDGFDPQQKRSVDNDIYYKLEEVTKFKYIDCPLYYYRENEKGISQGKNAAKALVYEKIAKYNAYKRRLGTKIPNLSKQEMSTELLLGAIYAIKLKNLKRTLYFLKKSVIICPFNFGGYLMFIWRLIKFPFYRLLRKIYPEIERIYD